MRYQRQSIHRAQVEWTPERVEILRREYPAGTPLARIAWLTGASEKAVAQQANLRNLRRPGQRGEGWTALTTALLVKLWADGFTGAEISREIGNGLSRGAVIAKANRMGLPARRDRPGTRSTEAIAAPVVPRDVRVPIMKHISKLPLPKPHQTDIARKQLADLERCDCRWPVGEPRDPAFGFCAAERVPGSSYCDEHLFRATRKRTHPAAPAELRVLEVVA